MITPVFPIELEPDWGNTRCPITVDNIYCGYYDPCTCVPRPASINAGEYLLWVRPAELTK